MNLSTLTTRFYQLVAPDIPNEWDVEEVLEPYLEQSAALRREAFRYVPVIWPISNSLCYDFLRVLPEISGILPPGRLSHWVGEILDRYELDGLRAAQRFMRDVQMGSLRRTDGSGLVQLHQVAGRLLPFIRGVAGLELQLAPGSPVHSDGETIFLPAELAVFPASEDNILLYKLMLAVQWAWLACGSFTVTPPTASADGPEAAVRLWLSGFFKQCPSPLFARDLYFQLETLRAARFLARELPGLMRAAARLPWPLAAQSDMAAPGRHVQVLLALRREIFAPGSAVEAREGESPSLARYCRKLATEGTSAWDSVQAVQAACVELAAGMEEYVGVPVLIFQGEPCLAAVEAVRRQRFAVGSVELVHNLALHLAALPQEQLERLQREEEEKRNGTGGAESDITMIMDSEFAGTVQEHQAPLIITINNEEVRLSEDLAEQTRRFREEFGRLPGRFISSAVGKAGEGMAPAGPTGAGEGPETQPPAAPLCYDEWDFRRQGFRKNWCWLNLKEIPLVHSDFIPVTLGKYHGLVGRLRHQFEMMRTADRFVRRQRDGDDIDLDAVLESLADGRAGLPTSERLYIKLRRDERDIAVLFLVDMSNSTAGWVGTSIKEALVLMTEALEVLGDRYAIYGFSGMRRTRCELFHIKHLGEPCSEAVRERIGAIGPSEYTRMGPAIRHATGLLAASEARVRLLITLSDGKPEDYDDYKGEYAIEDTRHALIEAKMAGIHPFCITIDHQAHDYIDHLYGPANAIFVNDVRKLPLRMPEIYRVLTT
ncbi:MAG: hypothetical protein BWK76_21245 [Desulfobulbaceae bacterium A2]|nr:MAG: hypothetical protein BWK76_21245 [Desulfobulbaceae bacterium A2]